MALSERYLAVEKCSTVEDAVFPPAGHNGDNVAADPDGSHMASQHADMFYICSALCLYDGGTGALC